MKNFFTLLFLFFLGSAQATTYYFSSLSGDDARTSVQAKSASTPWRSIDKLNSFFASLQPGDSVLFKRGETFYGSITIGKSGIKGSPIFIGAYGTGNRPAITGSTKLSNWSDIGNGIYESYNSSLGENLNMLLLNNAPQAMGRYPNQGYMTIESHVGKTSLTDNELSSAPNWAGAELVLRSAHWIINRCLITAHSGNTLSFSSANEPRNKYGYFIQNSPKTLDQLGEWYYNPSTKKVSMYFGTRSPSSYQITATALDYLIYSSSKSYIVFDNLTLTGANKNGFDINGGSNFTIKNCDVLFSGITGVRAVSNHSYFQIENSNVYNSNTNGILVVGATYATVRNNIVRNTFTTAGMAQGGEGNGSGIKIGYNSIAEYNQVINCGFVGMQFYGDESILKNNYIDTFCFIKDDGAGIYSSNGNNVTFRGRKVTGNIVLNGIGAAEGTDAKSPAADGIYMDGDVNGVEVTGNTVGNCNKGLYLHCSRDIVVKNNTFFNNNNGQLHMTYDGLGGYLRNHTITNNIFFSKLAKQMASIVDSKADDIGSMGRFDSNYYARPIDDRSVISNTTYLYASTSDRDVRDLKAWKAKFNKDIASKSSAKQVAPYTLKSLIGLNKTGGSATFSLSNDITKVWANYCALSWQNSGLLDGGYMKIAPSAKASSIVVRIGALSAGKNYILKYSLKGTSDMSISAYLRSSDNNPISATIYRPVSTTRSENDMIFTPSLDQTTASLVFNVDAQSIYYLDNIQLYEADATITNPDDSTKLVFNASQVSKTISLNGNYVDVKNNKYSNSISLQPYASAVLISNGGIQNAAPTVSITSPAANASLTAPASVTISAAAADTDGKVSKVDFYNGSTLLGTDTASPYTFVWNNVATGNYTLTAKATDNGSLSAASAAVTISVKTANVAPTVSITSPVTNATFTAPAAVTISAAAADSDGKVSKVDFYNGSTLLGTDTVSPYTFTWNNAATGSYIITAKATDNSSLVTASAAVTISVKAPNVAPTVSITSPVTNATFAAPASVTISAAAADADGKMSKVDFYNGSTLLGTDTASPYTFTWENVATGNYTITAQATDNGSLVTTSAAVTISVNTPVGAPSVSITSPVTNATFAAPASVTISAAAADADGKISKVDFYSGSTLLGTDTASPYTFTWNNAATGNYTISAKATDNSSLVTASAAVTISVYAPNVAPTVSITSVSTNASLNASASVSISAAAADSDGTISKVEFYSADTLIGTVTSAPYIFTWSNVASGNYTFTAKATDNKGAVTASSKMTIAVIAPIVTLRSANGVNNIAASNAASLSLKVFPNPASNTVFVSTQGLPQDKEVVLSVVSMNGTVFKTIRANTSAKTVEVNISSLSSGVYAIKASSGVITLNKQFVKL